jgi:Txe/YoeB family toxin of Txe-Axe toxin-antitoxin module
MEMEKIIEKWNDDAHIDGTELAVEQLKVPQLHNKYLKILIGERTILFKMKAKVKRLKRMLLEYYSRELNNPDDLIESDSEMIDLLLQVSVQEEKVNYLEAIIRRLDNRGWEIRNAIEWNKFTK